MFNIDENFVFGVIIMIQLCGIITVLASRFCQEDSRVIWNGLYFATLFLVGMITVLSIRLGSGHWLISSSTLAIMIVGATISATPSTQASAI